MCHVTRVACITLTEGCVSHCKRYVWPHPGSHFHAHPERSIRLLTGASLSHSPWECAHSSQVCKVHRKAIMEDASSLSSSERANGFPELGVKDLWLNTGHLMGMHYGIVAFTILAHITGLCGVGMLLRSEHSHRLLFEMTCMIWLFGFGVTAGLHRLWSHRSYKARPSFRILLWFLACGANQGSIIHWVRDHRAHHKYSDTDADPHNINRGFFFAHMGWLMQAKHPQVTVKGASIPLDDLHGDLL